MQDSDRQYRIAAEPFLHILSLSIVYRLPSREHLMWGVATVVTGNADENRLGIFRYCHWVYEDGSKECSVSRTMSSVGPAATVSYNFSILLYMNVVTFADDSLGE